MPPLSENSAAINRFAAYILVILIAATLYFQTTGFQFTLDDPLVTTLNSQVRDFQASDLANIFTSHFYSGASKVGSHNSNLYRPVAKLTFIMDYLLAGRNFTPGSFHLTNVILYALLCAVVLKLLQRLMPDSPLVTLCIAIMFTVLPSHTEVVANIKHREEILSLLFALSAWLAATPTASRKTARPYLAAVLYLLALLSKESALLLLPMFFLGEYAFRGALPRLSGLLLAAATLVTYFGLRFLALGSLLSPGDTMTFFLPDEGLSVRLLTSAHIFVKYYLWDQLVTQQLNPFFSHRFILQPDHAFSLQYLAAFASCLVLILSGLIVFFRKKSVAGYWLIFFFCTALLAMNIIPIGTAGAFRLIFTPSLGLCAVVVTVIAATCRLVSGNCSRLAPKAENLIAVVCLPLIIFYGYTTYNLAGNWQSDLTLFAYAARVEPRNPLSSYFAGMYGSEGLSPLKIRNYEMALEQYAANSPSFDGLSERDLEAYAIMASETGYYYLENAPMAAVRLADRGISAFNRLAVVRNDQHDPNAPAPFYVKALAQHKLGLQRESLASCQDGLAIYPHEGLRQLQGEIMGKRAY